MIRMFMSRLDHHHHHKCTATALTKDNKIDIIIAINSYQLFQVKIRRSSRSYLTKDPNSII